jgi:dextranase
MGRELSDLRSAYLVGEAIVLNTLPVNTARILARSSRGDVFEGAVSGIQATLSEIPYGTHVLEARSATGELLAEEFFSIRPVAGEDPIMGFVTSFDDGSREAVLSWLRELRCTVVQVYDWMNSYSVPLAPSNDYDDPLGRSISRSSLATLIHGIRELGAVAQAYAPILAAGDDLAEQHPEWRLFRNDGAPESLGDLLQIMDPGNVDWQRHWVEHYGAAFDSFGFDGFHLDTYGYPRNALNYEGTPVSLDIGFQQFVLAVRTARPDALISFNQVNGVPRGFEPPTSPSFRYVEVWPPNDRWRHLEGLLRRSAGDAGARGDTLALYPPVWGGDRAAALRTAVLSEAVATLLGATMLIWGDDHGVLCHPYYVDHESLTEEERRTVLQWHRFNLRCRDLFRAGIDTSWYELSDENASVTVEWGGVTSPEPEGGALFARVRRRDDLVVVGLLDLSGSAGGTWMEGTAEGRVETARVTILLDDPARWRAEVALLGRDGGRFSLNDAEIRPVREGRALSVQVPLNTSWAVLRVTAMEVNP